jgi:hypothetical protein
MPDGSSKFVIMAQNTVLAQGQQVHKAKPSTSAHKAGSPVQSVVIPPKGA